LWRVLARVLPHSRIVTTSDSLFKDVPSLIITSPLVPPSLPFLIFRFRERKKIHPLFHFPPFNAVMNLDEHRAGMGGKKSETHVRGRRWSSERQRVGQFTLNQSYTGTHTREGVEREREGEKSTRSKRERRRPPEIITLPAHSLSPSFC
jgi:hypothetical protein